jgi:uncharacterized protein YjbI with pentapeptide repeats
MKNTSVEHITTNLLEHVNNSLEAIIGYLANPDSDLKDFPTFLTKTLNKGLYKTAGKSALSLANLFYSLDRNTKKSIFKLDFLNENVIKEILKLSPEVIKTVTKYLENNKKQIATNIIQSLSIPKNIVNIQYIEEIISSWASFREIISKDIDLAQLNNPDYIKQILKQKSKDAYLLKSIELILDNIQSLIKNNSEYFLSAENTLEEKIKAKQDLCDLILKENKHLKLELSRFLLDKNDSKAFDLSNLTFDGKKISHQDLSDINFSNANFTNIDFSGSNLENTNFTFCSLSGTIKMQDIDIDQKSLSNLINSLNLSAAQGNVIELDTNIPELCIWYQTYCKEKGHLTEKSQETLESNYEKIVSSFPQNNNSIKTFLLNLYSKEKNKENEYGISKTDILIDPKTCAMLKEYYLKNKNKPNIATLLENKIDELYLFYIPTERNLEWLKKVHSIYIENYGNKEAFTRISELIDIHENGYYEDVLSWSRELTKQHSSWFSSIYNFYSIADNTDLVSYYNLMSENANQHPEFKDMDKTYLHQLQLINSVIAKFDSLSNSRVHAIQILDAIKTFDVAEQEKILLNLDLFQYEIKDILISNSENKIDQLKKEFDILLSLSLTPRNSSLFEKASENKYKIVSDLLLHNAHIILKSVQLSKKDNSNISQFSKLKKHFNFKELKQVNLANLPSLLMSISPKNIQEITSLLDDGNIDRLIENILSDKDLLECLVINKDIIATLAIHLLDNKADKETNKDDIEIILTTITAIISQNSSAVLDANQFLNIDDKLITSLTSSLINILKNNPILTKNLIDRFVIQHQSEEYETEINKFLEDLKTTLKDNKLADLEEIFSLMTIDSDNATFLSNFTNSQIAQRKLEFTEISDFNFDNLTINNFSFANSSLSKISLKNAKIYNVDFSNISIKGPIDFSNCTMDIKTYRKLLISLCKIPEEYLINIHSIKLVDDNKKPLNKYEIDRIKFIGSDVNKLIIDEYVGNLVERKIIKKEDALTLCESTYNDFSNLMHPHQQAIIQILQNNIFQLDEMIKETTNPISLVEIINNNRDKLGLIDKIQSYRPLEKSLEKQNNKQEKISLMLDISSLLQGNFAANYGGNLLSKKTTFFGKILNKAIQYFSPQEYKFYYTPPNPSVRLIESCSFSDCYKLLKIIRKNQPNAIKKILSICDDFGWNDIRSDQQVAKQYSTVIQELFTSGVLSNILSVTNKDGSKEVNNNFVILLQGYIQSMNSSELLQKQDTLEKIKNKLTYGKIAYEASEIKASEEEIIKLEDEIKILSKNQTDKQIITQDEATLLAQNLIIISDIVSKYNLLHLINDFFVDKENFFKTYQKSLSKLDSHDQQKLLEALNIIAPLAKIYQNIESNFSINADNIVIDLTPMTAGKKPEFLDLLPSERKENYIYSKVQATKELLYKYCLRLENPEAKENILLIPKYCHLNQAAFYGSENDHIYLKFQYNKLSSMLSNFKNVDIEGWQKEKKDSQITFTKSKFNNVKITDSDFSNANMSLVTMVDCNLINTDLQKVDFSNTHIQYTKFSDCKFSENKFYNAVFDHVTFENIQNIDFKTLSKAQLSNCTFVNCTFKDDVDFKKLSKIHKFENCRIEKKETTSLQQTDRQGQVR